MSEKDNGGSAFPNMAQFDSKNVEFIEHGMTIRDYFAARVLQGDLSTTPNIRESSNATEDASLLAEWAYQVADAMLEARKK